MQHRVNWYVGAIALTALLAAVGVFVTYPLGAITPSNAAIGITAFAVAAELLTYRLPGGGEGSIALVPFMAAALVAPDVGTIVAIGLGTAAVYAVRRRPFVRSAFNTAQAVLAISLGILTYRAVGGLALEAGWSQLSSASAGLRPTALLAGVFVLVNTIAVSGVMALTENVRVLEVWKRNTLKTAVYYVFTAPSAYGLAYVYARWGAVAAISSAMPLIAIRQLYKTTHQLQQTNRELLELMIKAIEARDPYTSGHSRRVADAAIIIARSLGLRAWQVERVRIAALLHDIGKIDEVFAPILRKEGRLTPDEWAVMKTHPVKGAELVATLTDLRDVVAPIRSHHEHWDGRGYPDGLAGDQIPLAARIITFADTMDALTTDRPYRRALGPDEVRSEFERCRGTQFDPQICERVLSHAVWAQLFPPSTTTLRPRLVRAITSDRAVIA
jgi:putative nucleotidyltransferase with HDIG domain